MTSFVSTYPSGGIHSGNNRSLKVHHIKGILLLLGVVLCALLYKAAATSKPDPSVQVEQILYEQEQIRLQRATLHRNDALKFYGTVSLLSTINLSLLILAFAIARAKLRRASICSARIGEHSDIPVRWRDLPQLYPIAQNLSQAELEASVSTSHDKAYQITRQMVQDVTNYTRALAGTFARNSRGESSLGLGHTALPLDESVFATPSVAELLRTGTLAPGKPLVVGYTLGQPQYRELHDLKSMAVAGWQGSGKTRSMAYLIAAAVLTHKVQVFVVDPHKEHPESLTALIQPLTKTGQVTIVNPFDTPDLITRLNNTLDRRLCGQEPSSSGILLVIDELARMAKMDYFDELVTLLERCTEETRKANITFLGGSPKWTARHFKGRADIRGCMNSMLIHKTKPSQADLLLEDAQDKRLIKQVQQPGDAILVTDYAPPVIVSMPFCTQQDMAMIAEMIGQKAESRRQKAEGNTVDLRDSVRAERVEAPVSRPFDMLRANGAVLRSTVLKPEAGSRKPEDEVRRKQEVATNHTPVLSFSQEKRLEKEKPVAPFYAAANNPATVSPEEEGQSISIEELKRQVQASQKLSEPVKKLAKKPVKKPVQEPAKKPSRTVSQQRASDVIPLASHRRPVRKPADVTVEILVEQIAYRKRQEKGVTQASIARWAGMSPSLLSRILNGHTALTDVYKQKLHAVLFDNTTRTMRQHANV